METASANIPKITIINNKFSRVFSWVQSH